MIFKETDQYRFVCRNGDKTLLKNNITNQYEIWIQSEPHRENLIWIFYNTCNWMTFDHIANTSEIEEFHTI